ncbi:MAG: hypothetical protein ACOY4L_01965 [Pseudomonadota bacterium]
MHDDLDTAIAQARQTGEASALIDLLFRRAMELHDQEQDAAAIAVLEEAVALANALDGGPTDLLPQLALAHLLRQQGAWERAQTLYQDALRRVRSLDLAEPECDKVLGQIFLGLGRIFEARGQAEAAADAWRRSLGFFRHGGHREWAELLEHLLQPAD